MQSLKIAAVLTLATASVVNAQTGTDVSAWRQDLKVIAAQLPATHPNAFYRMKRATWDSAVASLDSRLPSMTRNQAMVALSQLVAMVNDGHTGTNPFFDRAMGMHYYPVRFELFDDGLFIGSAAPKHASIVGGKVVSIGKVSAEQAVREVASTFGHENEWWIRAWAPMRLSLSEVLDGLGLAQDPAHLPVVIEKDGKRTTVTLEPTGRIEPTGHNPLGSFDTGGWVSMRAEGATPLWLRNPDRPYWAEFVQGDGTLYVSYRAVVSMDNQPNTAFWQSVFAMADSLPVKRLVIDLRENIGGNSFYNKQVIRGIIARPKLDRPSSLFVITGERTFSAAMNLALDLEQWTNATLVGVPTGNATMFFGDHKSIVLPVSGITVNVSTLPWHPDDPRDVRSFIAPRLFTPMTSASYRSNVDPAMQAILKLGSSPSLSEGVEAALSRGDSAGALKLVTDAARDPINRFRSPEADVNALGYRLLPTDRGKALAVFRMNTVAFPQSANTWDSYGETLLSAGDREAAIVAYRKAVALDPRFDSALEALRRLGAR